MQNAFRGIYPVLYTFFDSRGAIDRAAMQREVEVCIDAGASGITILGIAGESTKMNVNERRRVLDIVAEAVAGRVPLAPIINEISAEGQIEFVRAAEDAGAAFTILQPPQIKGIPEAELVRFLGSIADRATKPVAIQNNPVNLEVALSNASLKAINRNHANVSILKGEAGIALMHQLMQETEGVFDVFSGLGGRELTLTQRIGCVGCMPAPDWVDIQVRIVELLESGDDQDRREAERLYRSILPAIQFMLHSPAHMLCYGKHTFALRAGIGGIHPRAPAITPTDFGLQIAGEFVREFGGFSAAE